MLFAALAFVAGCGGGSGSSSVQSAAHQGSAGMGTFSYQGDPKPLVTVSSGQITSATMAGASFTGLALHPNPTLSNTDLLWSTNVNGIQQIFKFNYPNGPAQAMTTSIPGYEFPTQSKYGSVYFSGLAGQGANQMLIDGTHLKTLSTGQPVFEGASVNPAGTSLAFQSNGALYICPIADGTSTEVQASTSAIGTTWAPTGATLAYTNLISGGYSHIFTTPTTGGTPTDVTPSELVSENLYSPSWNPTGNQIAAECAISNGSTEIVVMSSASANSYYYATTPSTYNDFTPAFSPDGSKIAFYRNTTGGAVPGIYTQDVDGLNQQLLYQWPAGAAPIGTLCWSPFPSAVTYVPNSSFSVGAVSGFILTQNGSQFDSLLGFVAKTPSAATVTGSSTTGNQSLVFTLSADAITNIVYTNAYFSYATTVTPPASTPSALVTVDATTGAVDLVATAAKPVAKFAPSTRSIGSNLTYDGSFTAIYGPKGARLDTNGANQIVVDGKTGKLISFK